MIQLLRCRKCKNGDYDEEELEGGLCPKCRGLKECENCEEWVVKVNGRGLCKKCIPRYVKISSIEELVKRNTFGYGEGELERIRSSVDAIISTLGEIVACLPEEIREKILTIEDTSIPRSDTSFIKEEDKLK